MNTFLVVAAFMAAIAATAVALPLLRNRQSRLLGALAGVLVIGAAAVLYPLWSNWNWHAAAQAQVSPDVLAMVAKLEQRMREQPNDLAGWLMLGRSYLALERVDDAIAAYEHARALDAEQRRCDAGIGRGDEPARRRRPHAGGGGAVRKGGDAGARQPEGPVVRRLCGRGARRSGDGAQPLASAQEYASAGGNRGHARCSELPNWAPAGAEPASGTAPPARRRPAPRLRQRSISALRRLCKSRLTDTAQLFVFAREPGGQGPPLAAKRLTSSAIGTQIHLSSADSMLPGRTLVAGQRVSIVARVSFSGQPLPAAGDLYGELTYEVGHDGARDLVIDRVAE